jgi:hypothetical protein
MQKLYCVKTCITLVLFLALFSVNVHAEKAIESSVESRLYLAFQVQENDLQSWLPEPWRVSSIPSGPSKGANLTVIFVQTLFCETMTEAKPSPTSGMARYVVLTVPGKHSQTGEESVFVTRVYTTDPDRIPGHYKNAVKADMLREHSLKIENMEPGTGSDYWQMKEANGGSVKVQITYKRSSLNRAKWERVIRSAVDPNLSYIYKVDQSAELLKSVPTGVDQLQSYDFRSSVSELSKLLNDNAKLVSVTQIPCFILQVSQP